MAVTNRSQCPRSRGCAGGVHRHGVDMVELWDLQCFGHRTRLDWPKKQWKCPMVLSQVVTFTESDGWPVDRAATFAEWACGGAPGRSEAMRRRCMASGRTRKHSAQPAASSAPAGEQRSKTGSESNLKPTRTRQRFNDWVYHRAWAT